MGCCQEEERVIQL